MNRKVTMQDIADQLGLSKNSVSQALTGKSGVSEETRKLIMQTAEQLGYRYTKGKNKQTEHTKRTGNIALIASDYAFSQKNFFGEIYLSIERQTAMNGKHLLIQSVSQETMHNLILPAFVTNNEVDGILILSHLSVPYMKAIISTGIPTVLIDHHHPDVSIDCVLTNNRFSAYHAVQHLAELGHKQIGYIGNIHFSPSYYERMEGYKLALHQFGLEVNEKWIITDAIEQQDYITQKMGSLESQPTAWFCVNDGLGFLVNSCLIQLGYQIPNDISICSFDNGQLSQLTVPSTTTVDVDLTLFGRKAVDCLFWRINHPDEPFLEYHLPTRLIKRDSTQAPPTKSS